MAAFVGDHRFEGKILRVCIALECFGIDGEQILFSMIASAILRAPGLAINLPILNTADEAGRRATRAARLRRARRSAGPRGLGDERGMRASYQLYLRKNKGRTPYLGGSHGIPKPAEFTNHTVCRK
jgi:hypothetical protein